MKVTIIGCFGAYPEPNGATSGYLVESGNTKVLVDCGSGVLAKLQNYIGLEELDAVVFSHFHRDHCADLECLQYAAMIDMKLRKRQQPLVMWGAEGESTLATFDERYCTIRTYAAQVPFQIGDIGFTAQANVHDIPSNSLKITDADGVFVYSGDTGYYDQLCSFAQAADCFLCECSLYASQQGIVPGHLCSAEVGTIAAKANVRRLILTHLPHYGDLISLVQETGQNFPGDIGLARPGMVITI